MVLSHLKWSSFLICRPGGSTIRAATRGMLGPTLLRPQDHTLGKGSQELVVMKISPSPKTPLTTSSPEGIPGRRRQTLPTRSHSGLSRAGKGHLSDRPPSSLQPVMGGCLVLFPPPPGALVLCWTSSLFTHTCTPLTDPRATTSPLTSSFPLN